MLLFLFMISISFGEVIKVRILYEKEVDKAVQSIHDKFVRQIVTKYNEYLRKAGIYIELDKLSSLSTYDITEDELELAGLAGSDNISGRIRLVKKINKGVILIASTSDFVRDRIINKSSPCNLKLVTSYLKKGNIHDEALTNFILAYQSWLKEVLQAYVPNIYLEDGQEKMETLVSNLKNSNFKKQIIKCNNLNGENKETTNPDNIGEESLVSVSAKLGKVVNSLEILIDQNNKSKEKKDLDNKKLKPDNFFGEKITKDKQTGFDEMEDGEESKSRKNGVRLDLLDEDRRPKRRKRVN